MDVEKVLEEAGVRYTTHEHPAAYTAQEMAAEEHVSGDAVAKPVLVQADERNVMCVLPASCKVDLGKLAKILNVRKCQLMPESQMAGIFTDVEVGAEPPFGKLYGVDTLVDTRLASCPEIIFACGTHRKAIRLAFADYTRLAESVEADFSVHL